MYESQGGNAGSRVSHKTARSGRHWNGTRLGWRSGNGRESSRTVQFFLRLGYKEDSGMSVARAIWSPACEERLTQAGLAAHGVCKVDPFYCGPLNPGPRSTTPGRSPV